MSVVTIIAESDKLLKPQSTNSAKSMESNCLYSQSSGSKFSALNRRKISAAQRMQRERNPGMVQAVSEVKQRVLSARMLRTKQLQNQLGEMHHRISELTAENRLLKSLHKRQDSALSKYENSNAELPQLLQNHSEEVRTWQARARALAKQIKEFQHKIKQKDAIILATSDQNKHLLQLNKDKNLEERERLADRVRDLEHRLLDKDNDIKLLARRLQLETKTFKAHLQNEHQKYRELTLKLEQSHLELSRANGLMEMCENKTQTRFHRQHNHQKNCVNGKIKASKSASSVGSNQDTTTPTLPPFYDSNFDGGKTARSSPTLHKAKNMNLHDELEDLIDHKDDYNNNKPTKVEKSEKHLTNGHFFENGESLTSAIKNGVDHARSRRSSIPKASTKLTPLIHKTNSKKYSDSEFSFEDEGSDEFNLLQQDSEARTETIEARAQKKRNEFSEHQRNIEDLEAKLAETSLEHQEEFEKYQQINGPEAILDVIQARHAHRCFGGGDSELESMKKEMQESTFRRESLLDDFCDDVTEIATIKTNGTYGTNASTIKKLDLSSQAAKASNIPPASKNKKSKEIDPTKKSKLLQALKAIDGSEEQVN